MFMFLPFPLGRNSEREEKKEPHDGELISHAERTKLLVKVSFSCGNRKTHQSAAPQHSYQYLFFHFGTFRGVEVEILLC